MATKIFTILKEREWSKISSGHEVALSAMIALRKNFRSDDVIDHHLFIEAENEFDAGANRVALGMEQWCEEQKLLDKETSLNVVNAKKRYIYRVDSLHKKIYKCAVCDRPMDGFTCYVCSGCGRVFYCSRRHQDDHWNEHKLECYVVNRQMLN